jgi:hypothetical protein
MNMQILIIGFKLQDFSRKRTFLWSVRSVRTMPPVIRGPALKIGDRVSIAVRHFGIEYAKERGGRAYASDNVRDEGCITAIEDNRYLVDFGQDEDPAWWPRKSLRFVSREQVDPAIVMHVDDALQHFVKGLQHFDKALQHFVKGPWKNIGHNEFRRRLAHALLTLGEQPFPDDMADSNNSTAARSSTPNSMSSSLDSATGLFAGPSFQHIFAAYNKEKHELHTCAYCGHRTQNYCVSCYQLGRGPISVCGRRSGRDCIDRHACNEQMKHSNFKLVRNAVPSSDATPSVAQPRKRRTRSTASESSEHDE